MSSGSDISTLYREFTDAPTEILAENAVGPARRGRLARERTAVKRPGVQRIQPSDALSSTRGGNETTGTFACCTSRRSSN